MSEQNDLSDEEREVERSLQSLSPSAGKLSPIGAAFAAGRRSARRQIAAWRTAASLMLLIAASAWLPRPAAVPPPPPAESVTVASETMPPLSAQSVAMLQQTVLKHGIDSLPPSTIPGTPAVTAGDTF